MSDVFSLDGLAETLKAFDDFAEHVNKSIADNVALSLLRIQGEAKKHTPVDKGRLRAGNQIKIDADRLGGVVYNDVYYGPFVEWGTRFMAARPFLYPAHAAEVPKFLERLGKSILKFGKV